MIKILKETFDILNKNLWLLFLFMTVSYVGLVYFFVLKSSAHNPAQIIVGLITLCLIAVAGVAGLFHCATETINMSVTSTEVKRGELLKAFPRGVGEYFVSSLGIIFLYLVVTALFLGLAFIIGKNFIGLFSFSPEDFTKAMTSVEAMAEFQRNLSDEDLIRLSQWHFMYIAISSILTFLLLYWIPEIFYKTKNSLFALFFALKKVFLHPLLTLQLFLAIAIINILTSFIMALLLMAPPLMFLVYFIYFYSLLYIMLLMLNFYRVRFVEVEAPRAEVVQNTEPEEDAEDEENE